MRSGRALAAAFCGSILMLAACSDGGGDPVVLPTATGSTTTATETASPSAPPSSEPTPTTTLVLPDEHVPEVDEFVRAFFAAYNAAQDSGDFAAFDAMYLPQCTGCLEMRDELVKWLADGGAVEGADWVILQQTSAPFLENFDATVVAYRTDGSRVEAGDAVPIQQSPIHLFNFFIRSLAQLTVEDLGLGEAA